jgi:membrane-associated phospholipid phosphatase
MIHLLRRTNPTERFTAGYGLGFGVLISAIGPVGPGLIVASANVLVAAFVLAILPRLRASERIATAFLGQILPLLVFYLFYRECAVVLSQPGVAWQDLTVETVDRALIGPIPASHAAIGEWLALGYMTYVPVLVTAALILAWRARSPAGAQEVVRPICIVWGVCYGVFVLFPVLGPRLADPTFQLGRLGTGPFSTLAVTNQRFGMLRGAAFPSAHVAATVAALLAVRRGTAFWLLLPIGLSIPIAAVYLGYHYVSDVIVGAGIALAAAGAKPWRAAARTGG